MYITLKTIILGAGLAAAAPLAHHANGTQLGNVTLWTVPTNGSAPLNATQVVGMAADLDPCDQKKLKEELKACKPRVHDCAALKEKALRCWIRERIPKRPQPPNPRNDTKDIQPGGKFHNADNTTQVGSILTKRDPCDVEELKKDTEVCKAKGDCTEVVKKIIQCRVRLQPTPPGNNTKDIQPGGKFHDADNATQADSILTKRDPCDALEIDKDFEACRAKGSDCAAVKAKFIGCLIRDNERQRLDLPPCKIRYGIHGEKCLVDEKFRDKSWPNGTVHDA